MPLDAVHPVLVNLRFLKIQTVRCILHPFPAGLYDGAAATRKDMHDLRDIGVIFLLGNTPNTASFAAAEVEVETGTEFLPENRFGVDLQLAGAERIDVGEEFQQGAGMQDRAVWAEIAVAAGALNPPRQEYAGKLFSGHLDPGIGLGILQEDIVTRFILLDKVVFQQQRIRLGIHHAVLRIGDLAYEDTGLGRQPLSGDEVLCHPLVKVFGLSHINNLPLGVIVTVDAGGMGKKCYFLPEGHLTNRAMVASISSPRKPRARMVPSGPMRIRCGMAVMP